MPTTRESQSKSPPPGWAPTPHPLRIAILGWARLSQQAREGSGYNLNASELAAGLSYSGHAVAYLRSGMDYTPLRAPHTRFLENWRGIECYGLFNSTNLSPAATNFRNPRAEMSAPRDTALVLGWLDQVRAQLVHVHSLEGFPLDLIAAIRASGRPVVITPHNYWYGCPQVDLLHQEKRVCTDYDGGRRCVGCIESPDPARARRRRAIDQFLFRALGHVLHSALRQFMARAKRRASGAEDLQAAPQPDPESALGIDHAGTDHPGLVHHGWELTAQDSPVAVGTAPLDQNERFLEGDRHLVVLNDYGRRRAAGIDALNHASLVTPPSRFVLEAMHAMGLKRALGRHVRLGQPHFDALNRKTRRSPYYQSRPWDPATATRPLRLGFCGTVRNNKGLEVLAGAIPLLEKSVRQRCHFSIRASGNDWPFRKRLGIYPEVSLLGGYDVMQLPSAMDEFDVGILPHIWFENSPLVLLEFLHAGKFVISARLGGPPEWIVEPAPSTPGNGLLFAAGHSDQLAAAITRLVTGEVELPSAKQVHECSLLRSYPDHIREVQAIYYEVMGIDVPGATPVMTVPDPVAAAFPPPTVPV